MLEGTGAEEVELVDEPVVRVEVEESPPVRVVIVWVVVLPVDVVTVELLLELVLELELVPEPVPELVLVPLRVPVFVEELERVVTRIWLVGLYTGDSKLADSVVVAVPVKARELDEEAEAEEVARSVRVVESDEAGEPFIIVPVSSVCEDEDCANTPTSCDASAVATRRGNNIGRMVAA